VDDPGGGVDDPGGGNTDDLSSFGNLATSTTTSSKTSVSFVSSSLTTGISLLSLSDMSAVDVVGDLDVDCATGLFCSSCAIPPRVVGGLWSDGVGCDVCVDGERRKIPIRILERTERTLSLPSVKIYRYFFYRLWARGARVKSAKLGCPPRDFPRSCGRAARVSSRSVGLSIPLSGKYRGSFAQAQRNCTHEAHCL
jgi:hypothetical protein